MKVACNPFARGWIQSIVAQSFPSLYPGSKVADRCVEFLE